MYTTATAKDNFHDKSNRTVDDLKDVKDGIRRVKDDVRDIADTAKDDLHSIAREAGKRVHAFVDSATQNTSETAESIKTKMQESPFKTSAIALGIGFVVGMIFRR